MSIITNFKTFEKMEYKNYFHGSSKELPENYILKPHDESYTKLEENSFLEKIFEKYRPEDKLSRYDSVFLMDNDDPDLIEAAGGDASYVYSVYIKSNTIPEKSDLAWYTYVQMLLDDYNEDDDKIKEAVLNYWNGVPFFDDNESLFEYRVPRAMVLEDMYSEDDDY